MAKTEINVVYRPANKALDRTSLRAFIFDTAFKGGRIVIGTGISIKTNQWLMSNKLKDVGDNDKKNKQLEDFTNAAKEVFAEMNKEGKAIENKDFKNRLNIKLESAPATKETNTLDIFGYINDRLVNNYSVSVNKQIRKLKPRTITNKKQVLTKLKDYRVWKPKAGEKVIKVPVSFETMNSEFYISFIYYLSEELKHSTNTRGKIIKTLKNFLSHAQSDGYKVNPQYKEFVCEVGESKEVTYLDETELLAIRTLDLSDKLHLDRVRDLFVFAAYTGFRYSDVYGFKKHWVDERTKLITYKQQKTEKTVSVPLSNIVLEILLKYDYALPRISNQKANKHIKEVCALAKIEKVLDVVKKLNTETGKEEFVKILKWQTVTTHDARRSFCSNLYHNKIPTYKIMKLSGHTTEASFLRYIGIDEEENALEIGLSDYFNTTTLTVSK